MYKKKFLIMFLLFYYLNYFAKAGLFEFLLIVHCVVTFPSMIKHFSKKKNLINLYKRDINCISHFINNKHLNKSSSRNKSFIKNLLDLRKSQEKNVSLHECIESSLRLTFPFSLSYLLYSFLFSGEKKVLSSMALKK